MLRRADYLTPDPSPQAERGTRYRRLSLVDAAWGVADAAVVRASGREFGRQWNELGEQARVSLDDLRLHLPSGWDDSTFGGDVLDAGCGMGRYAALAASLGANVCGLDVSDAVDKGAALWPELTFVQADLAAPPFAPASFDLVYSFGVLHHLPDPLRGFRACFDLVRPGGRLLVWTYSAHGGPFRAGRRFGRAITRRFGFAPKPLAWAATLSIRAACLLPGRLSPRGAGGRLRFYANKGLRQLYVDCHDALAAPHETYLTEDDCRAWLAALGDADGGYERRRDGSGWLIWARKGSA